MKQLEEIVASLTKDIDLIADEKAKSIVKTLVNLIELLASENNKLKKQNQDLKDEINQLKGEQGKPKIRKQTQENQNVSSETERKRKSRKKQKKAKKKKHKIKINRTKICEIERNKLPDDAEFKGYQSTVVQDILIKTDNIEFRKKVYYSPSLKKTFIANLPDGYHGEFGPKVKALILDLHHSSKMTESAIHKFLTNHSIYISASTISRIITDNHEDFHQEKKDIIDAGLSSSIYQQMDDTGARVNGQNYYTHILCSELYTAYFTRQKKDRLTILDILTSGEIKFRFDESTYALLEQMKLPKKQLARLMDQNMPIEMTRDQADRILKRLFPDPKKHITNKRIILEAGAIASYQQLSYAIKLLLTDDAPQFKQITDLLALCWIHDGRHYKKLNPIVPKHKIKLKNFLTDYWNYYHKLLNYKEQPTNDEAAILEKQFDNLFSTITDYDQLDERIKKTKFKKNSLLLVLKYPNLPLHNNTSELGARTQARYRDISFHTINKKGTEAKDTFMTIVETAKKLAVNSYHYFYDRISKKYNMPPLAQLIKTRATELCGYNYDPMASP
jgi:hypothetical protein